MFFTMALLSELSLTPPLSKTSRPTSQQSLPAQPNDNLLPVTGYGTRALGAA
jgi:hypothetical protein